MMSGRQREFSASVDLLMQQYLSPTADGQDAVYYDAKIHPHYNMTEHQEDSDQARPLDSSPRRPQSRQSFSAEELQLAAQLTQGLAAQDMGPIIPAENIDSRLTAADGEVTSSQQAGGQQTQEQDQQLSKQLREHLQKEALHSQSHPHAHAADAQHIARHAGAVAGQRYDEDPQHGALEFYSLEESTGHPQDRSTSAQIAALADHALPPRKRSKVSRACDECRRKKIKCDAVSEASEEPCSNCRRSNARCLFSRVPQKRGPSKGYIKELADRIHHIEGKLGGQGLDALDLSSLTRRESSDVFSPSIPLDENSRKRPYATISGDVFPTQTPSRPPAWASESRHDQQTPTSGRPYSANGLAPRPLGGIQSEPGALGKPEGLTDGGTVADDLAGLASREITEEVFQGYLMAIHPTYPALASTKHNVHATLEHCPPALREAFIEALNAAVGSFEASSAGQFGDSRTANRWLTAWESEGDRSDWTNLVYLQTLILLAIETDNHGPASLSGQHGGPTKTSLLGRAVGQAYSMNLHAPEGDLELAPNMDTDSKVSVGFRCWFTLVMMDRWNAISTSTPTLIPNDSVVILMGYRDILGDGAYYLLQLSHILGHLAPLAHTPLKGSALGSSASASGWINLPVESFRVNLPKTITPESHPIVQLAYWHVRLLSYLFSPSSLSSDLLWACKQSAGLLIANPQLLSPLNHHFTCLTGLCAVELGKVEKTRDEAGKLVKELLGSPVAPSAWDAAIRDKMDEKASSAAPSLEATADQSLQHLADLAAATEPTEATKRAAEESFYIRKAENYEDAGFNPRPMLRTGYLNLLAPVDPALEP